MDFERDLAIGD